MDRIKTVDGKKVRVRITYEIIAEKGFKQKKGTVLAKGRYKNQKELNALLKKKFVKQPREKKIREQYKKQTGHALERQTQLTHMKVVVSKQKKNMVGQVGGLFVFTYQMNGRTIVHDKYIENYSRRTKVPISQLSDQQIKNHLAQALSFARIEFLQQLGLETAQITLEEFVPPVLYKYYV